MSRRREDIEFLRIKLDLLTSDISTMIYNRGMSRILCQQVKDTFKLIITFFEEDVKAGIESTG